MRRLLIGLTLLALPSLAIAQTQPAQITNDDLLRLIGLQQVQNLQLGKALEACQQDVTKLKEAKKDATPLSPK